VGSLQFHPRLFI